MFGPGYFPKGYFVQSYFIPVGSDVVPPQPPTGTMTILAGDSSLEDILRAKLKEEDERKRKRRRREERILVARVETWP
jgi:hypothetical protein